MTLPLKPDLKLVEAKSNLSPEAAQDLVKRAVAAHCANPTLMDCTHAAFDCEIIADGRLLVVIHHTISFCSVFNVDRESVKDPGGVKFTPLPEEEIQFKPTH